MAHLKGIQGVLCFIKALACWLIYFWCLVVGILCMIYFWYKEKNSKLTVVLKKCIKLTIKIYINCKEKEENKFFCNLLLVGTFKIFFHYLWESRETNIKWLTFTFFPSFLSDWSLHQTFKEEIITPPWKGLVFMVTVFPVKC